MVVSKRLGQRFANNGGFAWLQHHSHLQSTSSISAQTQPIAQSTDWINGTNSQTRTTVMVVSVVRISPPIYMRGWPGSGSSRNTRSSSLPLGPPHSSVSTMFTVGDLPVRCGQSGSRKDSINTGRTQCNNDDNQHGCGYHDHHQQSRAGQESSQPQAQRKLTPSPPAAACNTRDRNFNANSV